MSANAAIEVTDVSHRYGTLEALRKVSLQIQPAEIFVFLGPNGSGKTTLFRLLSTLIPLKEGRITYGGKDLAGEPQSVRAAMGVVFQAPSLDKKLSVKENLLHQGRLYGMRGRQFRDRIRTMLAALGIEERQADLVETLSGGMRRRVELAKGLLHGPQLLLLDEPSTGLDPGARSDLWKYLRQIRDQDGVTIVLTTHLLEEAGRADRIAILHHGKLVALDSPQALQSSVGGDSITLRTERPEHLAAGIRERFQCVATVLNGTVRLEQPEGHKWVSRLVEAFPADIQEVTLGKPTLEDVFIDRTGHHFWDEEEAAHA